MEGEWKNAKKEGRALKGGWALVERFAFIFFLPSAEISAARAQLKGCGRPGLGEDGGKPGSES